MPKRDYYSFRKLQLPEGQEKILDIISRAWDECSKTDCTYCPYGEGTMRIMECTALKYSKLLYDAGFREEKNDGGV